MLRIALCIALCIALGSVPPANRAHGHDHGPGAGASAGNDVPRSPDRPDDEGDGPFERLIIRGGTLIDGTGSPPFGPVDIVIEGNRIVSVTSVGNPGLPIDPERRPELGDGTGTREVNADGMYILPGFVDMHGHMGGSAQGTSAEYVFKLWMGHGITTIRDPACGNGIDWSLEHRERSRRNEITAPRIEAYIAFGQGHDGPFTTIDDALAWVDMVADKGADGLKFFGYRPDIMRAAIERAGRLGLRSACHHAQRDVARVNVLDTARWGLTTMEHWYGLPEALFDDRTIQDYPVDYNYNNEQHRFGEAGRLWKQAAGPGSDRWNAVMQELIELDFTIVPTFTIYEASRDLMRERNADWHAEYTLPSLWRFFQPSRDSHGSYWFHWTTDHEIAWKENYRLWMRFINEYKNRGGRVAAGSDSGFIYKVYGFGFVRELELLREAGFHPLEVIRAATLEGAEAIGRDDEIGTVEAGKLADLVLVGENPLENFKVLYGTGAIKLDDNNEPTRVGGVRYTIKDGIVYDARNLLADVREIVREARATDDDARIRELHRELEAALAAGDAADIGGLLTDDVILATAEAGSVSGKAQVIDHLHGILGRATSTAAGRRSAEFTSTEVVVSGDWAFDRGAVGLGGATGTYVWMYRRGIDRDWKVARMIWNLPRSAGQPPERSAARGER